MAVITGWDDRLAWSGETPLNYPGLNPVAAVRFDDTESGSWADAVNPANVWSVPWAGTNHGTAAGPWGTRLGLNVVSPATEQGALTLPYFPGLWPSSGRLLLGLWVQQGYTMGFNPLMSSRSGSPVAYLSTHSTGRLRHNVYNAAGGSINSSDYEDSPWAATSGWQWVAMLVDFDARTSQIAAVERSSHRKFLGPVRALSGAPNPASVSPLEVFALPSAGYWTGGMLDEVFVAHPGGEFDFDAYVERVRLGTWATGAEGSLQVTDLSVAAEAEQAFLTGAQAVSWSARPEPTNPSAVPYWSTDDGVTWQTGTLPASLTGLLRWEVPLGRGAVFTGLRLLPPSPTLAPIADLSVAQQATRTVALSASWTGDASWSVAAPGLNATVEGSSLVLETGWASGDVPVTVSVRDSWGRVASRAFVATVEPLPWDIPPTEQYPSAPIVVGGEAVIDALDAVVVTEVNGEESLEFSIPLGHRAAGSVVNEAAVDLAGTTYRVRRVTTGRRGRVPVLTAYCEADFYDLAYAGQIYEREYLSVSPGQVMQEALRGTGWSIGSVTVTTRRTYSTDDTNPLALLRLVQKNHGGDLLFDGKTRTVSLVTRSGRDAGVAFIYGRDLTESKRVVDTTSLVTRIYARNAEGVTIAAVNNGKAYVEDYEWTDEVREATYDFASGTSPWTMLSMVQATLANRCKPSFSYQFTVADLSRRSGQVVDRFDVGDVVTVVDDDLGIRESQRILRVEHDIVRPWASKVTLSGKLRETGGSTGGDGEALSSGSMFSAFDLVPYNLLKNGRFDNALAHWASSGVEVVEGGGTGERAIRFQGPGIRWVEQTVQPDNRDVYSLSLRTDPVGGGEVPPLRVIATVEYEDGSTDVIPVELS